MTSVLAFLIAVVYWPGFVASASTPKWMLLSLAVPALLAFRPFAWTLAHTLGMAFLGWCALTLIWAVSLYDGIETLWHFILYGMIFCLGSGLRSVKGPLVCFALGVGISGLLAPLQLPAVYELLDWRLPDFILQAAPPAGLFMNRNYMAEAALCAAVGLVAYRDWRLAAPLLPLAPAVVLAGSAGAFASALLVGCTVIPKKLAALIVVSAVGIGAVWFNFGPSSERSSFNQRLSLYGNTAAMITPAGYGIGSYWAVYPLFHDAVRETPLGTYSYTTRPRTAHNDALTLGAETGIVGLILAALFALSILTKPKEPAWYVFAAFLCLGLFNFPLYHTPATAFLAFLCAGHLCRDRVRVRAGAWRLRTPFRARFGLGFRRAGVSGVLTG